MKGRSRGERLAMEERKAMRAAEEADKARRVRKAVENVLEGCTIKDAATGQRVSVDAVSRAVKAARAGMSPRPDKGVA